MASTIVHGVVLGICAAMAAFSLRGNGAGLIVTYAAAPVIAATLYILGYLVIPNLIIGKRDKPTK